MYHEKLSRTENPLMKFKRRSLNSATKLNKETKLSRTHAPADLSPVDWQRGLRRQFGREQAFGLENLSSEPFFSEFRVSNPVSKSSYRVAIRGRGPGGNFCSCPDYATSELGTCKHIEFTLARLEKKRGAKTAFARGYQPPFSELYLRNDGKRSVHFRAGTDCPPALREAAVGLFDAEHNWVLPDERLGELEHFMTIASKSGHELRAYDDALDFVAGRRDADRRVAKLAQLFPGGAADPKLLALLKAPLYPYQAEGALFAVRAGRALIGDDMGLGKTIQAIAATEILARHFGVSKVLVVCPTSLKYQWQSEIMRFSGRQGEKAARVINGGRAQRQKDYAQDDFWKITNYEKLRPDLDLIAAWAPELVIVDEAQRVKNWNTIAARALKRVDSPYAYGQVRLLQRAHRRLRPPAFRTPSRASTDRDGDGDLPVPEQRASAHARVYDDARPACVSRYRHRLCCLLLDGQRPELVLRRSIPRLRPQRFTSALGGSRASLEHRERR